MKNNKIVWMFLLFFFFFLLSSSFASAWWDLNYLKRQPINLSTSSGYTGENYQVLLNVTYDSDMQSDFDDLRFVDNDDITELDYYLDNKTDSVNAYVWVKVADNITTSNTTIYMYYSNAGASSSSDPYGTMEIYDDFNDASLNTSIWTNYTAGGYGKIREADGYIYVNITGGDWSKIPHINSTTTYNTSVRAKFRQKVNGAYGGSTGSGFKRYDVYAVSYYNDTAQAGQWDGDGYYKTNNYPDTSGDSTATLITDDTWYTFEIFWTPNYVYYTKDGGSSANHTNRVPNDYICVAVSVSGGGTQHNYVDWIFVTKYVSPEPIDYFGSEENPPVVPVVTLESPVDYYNSSSTAVDLNCSATGDALANITYWGNWSGGWHENTTTNVSGSQNSSLVTMNLTDGNWLWGCSACNDVGCNETFMENRTILIDTTGPSITLEYPSDDNYSINPLAFNCSTIDTNELKNISLWTNSTGSWALNETTSITGTSNSSEWSVSFDDGVYLWSCSACDFLGNCNEDFDENRTFTIDITAPNITLNSPADYGDETSPVVFNCSADDVNNLSNISLWTDYIGTWGIWATSSVSGSNNTALFSATMGSGTYTWSCSTCDSLNNCNTSFLDNRTVVVSGGGTSGSSTDLSPLIILLVGFFLLIIILFGFALKEFAIAALGAIGILVFGVYILTSGLVLFSNNLLTDALGIVCIALGAYILIVGGLHFIEEM